MIYNIASKAVAYMDKKGYLESENNDIIIYGLFSFISKMFYATLCITIGILFQICTESIVFYISFLFIKKYSGGFHCSTESKCMVVSSLSILLALSVITLLNSFQYINMYILILLASIGTVFIALKSPMPAKEKPLDEDEFRIFKKYSIIRILFVMLISILLLLFSYDNLAISLYVSIYLECVFLIKK